MPTTITLGKVGFTGGAGDVSRLVKRAAPSPWSSQEWMVRAAPAIRERALFSARVTQTEILQGMEARIRKLLQGETDFATMRLRAKEELQALGYRPEAGDEGTIKDLSSNQRIKLQHETNVEMAQGYGYWAEGQNPDVLDEWPCSELYRAEDRKEKRNWPERWVRAGGKLFAGRMIARKDDPVWEKISAFGTPYPPFDFGSGMDVRDVDRAEAERLGVIPKGAVVAPQSRDFNEGVTTEAQRHGAPAAGQIADGEIGGAG